MAERFEKVEALNQLLHICRDAEEGFRVAASRLHNSSHQGIFLEYSLQRSQFAEELRLEVLRLGGSVKDGGTVVGTLHRGWMVLKDKISTHDEHELIAEVARAEDEALEAYEKALDEPIEFESKDIVRRQLGAIRAANAAVHRLEHETETY